MKNFSRSFTILALGAALTVAHAQTKTTYRYTQDVSALGLIPASDAASLVYLAIQLSDGTNSGNGTSKVTVSNLKLTGGTIEAALPNIGNVTTTPEGIVLRDGDGPGTDLADYTVGIRVGSTPAKLSFDFAIETTSFDAPVPDYFNVSLLLSDLTSITTVGPIGREYVGMALDGTPGRTPSVFALDPTWVASRSALGDARFAALAAPTVTTQVVPEPATLAALGLGVAALARRRRRA